VVEARIKIFNGQKSRELSISGFWGGLTALKRGKLLTRVALALSKIPLSQVRKPTDRKGRK
jgi:hypothetical protein